MISEPDFAVTHLQKSKILLVDVISAACTDQTSKVTYLKLPQLNFETDRSSLECDWPIQTASLEYSGVETAYVGSNFSLRCLILAHFSSIMQGFLVISPFCGADIGHEDRMYQKCKFRLSF